MSVAVNAMLLLAAAVAGNCIHINLIQLNINVNQVAGWIIACNPISRPKWIKF